VNSNIRAGRFALAESWIGRTVVVSVSGDLDMLTAPELDEAIRTAAGQEPAAVIVDLSSVDFLASAGMNLLIAAHRDIAPAAGFGVVADGPSTGRPLKLIGFHTMIALYRNLDDALDDFA
jgi:anti-anti-sigma factor